MLLASALSRSRKPRAASEFLCERVFRPLAHLVVLALLPLRVPPPVVVAASGAAGLAGAVELARGHLVVAALLVQLKTILDNADGQLARLSGQMTAFGRYLDSEVDMLVDAALFAGLGWYTGQWLAALVGFVALTTVLSVNYNVERLYRASRGADGGAMPEAESRPTAVLRRIYAVVYAPQDRLVERFVERRLGDAPPRGTARVPRPHHRLSARQHGNVDAARRVRNLRRARPPDRVRLARRRGARPRGSPRTSPRAPGP